MKSEGRMREDEWKTMPLGEFAESVDYGVTASATEQPVGPKFLRITDIQGGAVNWNRVPWCECDMRSASGARLKTGDIVFARTGATTGKSFLIRDCPTDAVFASYLIRVRVGTSAEPRFVSHFFQTENYWAQVAKGARGVAQPGVNATTLKALQIPLPPLAEQRRVAEVLDQAEALRVKRRAALAQLDSLTQSLFLKLFGDPETNPKGWPLMSLREVLSIPLRNGLSPSKAGKVNAKVLTLSAITGSDFDATAWKTSTFVLRPPASQSVDEEDFLICRGNGNIRMVGKGYFPSCAMPETTFPDTMIAARIASNRIERTFLQHVWNSPAVRRQVESLARTTNGTFKVNQPSLEGISFVVPPLPWQREFVHRVTAVEKLKTVQRASLTELNALFASLQHRAFRGEI